MQVVCLDLEGVPVPEIWIEFSHRTGIAGFSRNPRDEPDYEKLMRQRLAQPARHGLTLADIQRVIEGMGALPGARAGFGSGPRRLLHARAAAHRRRLSTVPGDAQLR